MKVKNLMAVLMILMVSSTFTVSNVMASEDTSLEVKLIKIDQAFDSASENTSMKSIENNTLVQWILKEGNQGKGNVSKFEALMIEDYLIQSPTVQAGIPYLINGTKESDLKSPTIIAAFSRAKQLTHDLSVKSKVDRYNFLKHSSTMAGALNILLEINDPLMMEYVLSNPQTNASFNKIQTLLTEIKDEIPDVVTIDFYVLEKDVKDLKNEFAVLQSSYINAASYYYYYLKDKNDDKLYEIQNNDSMNKSQLITYKNTLNNSKESFKSCRTNLDLHAAEFISYSTALSPLFAGFFYGAASLSLIYLNFYMFLFFLVLATLIISLIAVFSVLADIIWNDIIPILDDTIVKIDEEIAKVDAALLVAI
ncbi:MAG: hypothetical protein LBD03_05700 [Methanobrevibacter sp.]|jgi:hypothetical protein|nr:hypothetical protein [Candidatus Methanovirga procula]